ncbi:DUF6460 domain-containing protein [Polycladidibacter stylochi]|uniref:DUF6460 domain-containing protein n=1 Tax=Polycladidibacter stylochi TaxID=1807766 RepID=UPI000830562B|nr:DUF6460 domain-containing protein [Pseudovibrio stylochi]
MDNNRLRRFLGESPVSAIVRLLLLSFVVGIILSSLDLTPFDLLENAVEFVQRIYNLGFDAIRWAGEYLLAGALVVIPIWLIMRFTEMKKKD